MSTLRRRSRFTAFQILYRFDLETQNSSANIAPTPYEIEKEVEKHFTHFEVAENVQPFAKSLALGTITNLIEIDAQIQSRANKWKMSRMDPVDRNLLRLSFFELFFSKETPKAVVMDEAIELAKEFGTADSASFINGILDSTETKAETKTEAKADPKNS